MHALRRVKILHKLSIHMFVTYIFPTAFGCIETARRVCGQIAAIPANRPRQTIPRGLKADCVKIFITVFII